MKASMERRLNSIGGKMEASMERRLNSIGERWKHQWGEG
jgi:hypothetical protein